MKSRASQKKKMNAMISNRRETNLIEDFAELGIDAIKK